MFEILKGDPNPQSSRTISPDTLAALKKVEDAIAGQFVPNVDYSHPLTLIIFNTSITPTGLFWQDNPIMWIHLPSSPQKSAIALL